MNIKWPSVNIDSVKRLRDGVYDQVKTASNWAKEKVVTKPSGQSDTEMTVNECGIILGRGAAEGPMYPFINEGVGDDIFRVGDRVFTTTAIGSIPTGSEVIISELVDNGLQTLTSITVHMPNDDDCFTCRRENLQLPVSCLQLSRDHHVPVFKTCDESDTTPCSMILHRDKIFVLRTNRTRTRFQIDTGGWVSVNSSWIPLYLPGSPVKCIRKVYFDNNRKVNSGCLGHVTANYLSSSPLIEVSVDGVVWDASPSHISPVIPQSIITVYECEGHVLSSDSEDSDDSPELKERTLCRSEIDSLDEVSEDSDDIIDTGAVKVMLCS